MGTKYMDLFFFFLIKKRGLKRWFAITGLVSSTHMMAPILHAKYRY